MVISMHVNEPCTLAAYSRLYLLLVARIPEWWCVCCLLPVYQDDDQNFSKCGKLFRWNPLLGEGVLKSGMVTSKNLTLALQPPDPAHLPLNHGLARHLAHLHTVFTLILNRAMGKGIGSQIAFVSLINVYRYCQSGWIKARTFRLVV